jgi:hypothetical protein
MDDGIAAAARYAQSAFERLVTSTRGSTTELANAALAAGGRMDVALRQRLAERASHDLKLQSHARMISVATRRARRRRSSCSTTPARWPAGTSHWATASSRVRPHHRRTGPTRASTTA